MFQGSLLSYLVLMTEHVCEVTLLAIQTESEKRREYVFKNLGKPIRAVWFALRKKQFWEHLVCPLKDGWIREMSV